MKKNITLIGMMGSGKTTTAKELSKILPEFKLVDIDDEIEKSSGKKISEIFLKYGEAHFRELETNKIKQFIQNDHQIISAGGGAFENPDNRRRLLENSFVFFLKASPQTIYDRIKAESHRPLLKKNFSVEKIANILSLREKNYQKANHTIETDKKTPEDIAKEIAGVINA
ncbi:shikimate kinase [bacterium]|uniref:Shikimate kinase n=1 Tax=Candidatus Scatenecus faecavium TaxID=2840915 RepID=A0A9D1K3U7_9BACT|nr:shikimate kinase [bacterium]HIS83152.1 shikimate kinase [Candidatus Scatenecus faecavium]